MKNRYTKSLAVVLLSLSLFAPIANSALITSTLGSAPGDSGFVDGQLLGALDLTNVPTPMTFDNNDNGSDPIGNFASTWTHTYSAITDTILSASLTIGIYDHDSASSGSQVNAFELDGLVFTPILDALFEGSGGANSEYNVYSVDLGASFFSELADGSLSALLNLQGPVASPAFLPTIPDQIDDFNGANLIFSTLNITTQDTNVPPGQVPTPTTFLMLFMGVGALLLKRKFL